MLAMDSCGVQGCGGCRPHVRACTVQVDSVFCPRQLLCRPHLVNTYNTPALSVQQTRCIYYSRLHSGDDVRPVILPALLDPQVCLSGIPCSGNATTALPSSSSPPIFWHTGLFLMSSVPQGMSTSVPGRAETLF